jgi:hypothetical protein
LIVFAGDKLSPPHYEAMADAGLIPGTIAGSQPAGDLPLRITRWEESHSIMLPFADPQHGDLQSLTFRGSTPIEPAATATVIARFNDGAPCLVEQKLGKGRVLWFGSSCDVAWSDWARSSLYVPMVHQMLGRLTGLNEGGLIRMVDAQSGGVPAADRPGVFPRENHYQVVNLDPRESEIERCSETDLANRFGIGIERNDTTPLAASATGGLAKLELRQNEFWHWIIVVLVALAVTEYLVANRVTA